MTTTGMTTSCSWNRVTAAGSASRTLVSRTKVWHFREVGELVLALFFTATAVSSVSPRASLRRPLVVGASGAAGLRGEHQHSSTLRPTMPFSRHDTPGAGCRVSGAEAAFAGCVRAHRAQEVDAAERRPERVAEVELRMDALPEQEAGEPLLPRGADDEVGVGLALGVEVLGDVVD